MIDLDKKVYKRMRDLQPICSSQEVCVVFYTESPSFHGHLKKTCTFQTTYNRHNKQYTKFLLLKKMSFMFKSIFILVDSLHYLLYNIPFEAEQSIT